MSEACVSPAVTSRIPTRSRFTDHEITYPDSERLVVDGCRRLTGPSLVWSETGAILDVLVEDMDMEQVLDCYRVLHNVEQQFGG